MSQTRRLAAILAADMAGYSRLMGADGEAALIAFAILYHPLEKSQHPSILIIFIVAVLYHPLL